MSETVNVFEEMVRAVQEMREEGSSPQTTNCGDSTSGVAETSRETVELSAIGTVSGGTEEKVGIVEIFRIDRNTMFEFRTGVSKGVVILVDYKKGELMRKGTCGVRVYSPGDMAYRVRTGFSFEQKHTVVYSPDNNLQKGQ